MDDLMEKLHVLAKTETILIRLYIQRAVRQMLFILVAALFGLLALGMLNAALYLFLAPRVGPAPAALIVAGLDLFLAILGIMAAGRLRLGPEAEAAASLRDLVSKELASDAERLREQLDDLGQDIKRIRSAVTGFAQPGSVGLSTMFQWIMMLLSYLRKKR